MSSGGEIAALVVQVVDDLYAIPCVDVVTVVPVPVFQTVPGAPPYFVGTFSYRGEIVPVVDLARAFRGSSSGNRLAARLVLTRSPAGLAAVIVGRVVDVRRIPRPSRVLDVPRHPAVADATLVDGRPIQLLSLAHAVPAEIRTLFAPP